MSASGQKRQSPAGRELPLSHQNLTSWQVIAAIPVHPIRSLHRPHPALCSTSGVGPDKATAARKAVDGQWRILAPEKDEMILRDAGFSNSTLLYTGFMVRGWVAYA